MEYTLDAVISFALFALTLAISFTLVINLIVLTLSELTLSTNPLPELVFPTSLEIISVREGYIIKSLKRCLITYVVIESDRKYYVSYGITPLKITAKPSSWIIVFTYTSVLVKRGITIQGQIVVSMYGVTTNKPIPPYVIIKGSSYEVMPRISNTLKDILVKDLSYSIYNNTVVLRVGG